jgi:hypothetical protein
MGEDHPRDPGTPAGGTMSAAGAKVELQRLNAEVGLLAALGDATHPAHKAATAAR